MDAAEAVLAPSGRNANHQTPTMATTMRTGTNTIGCMRFRRRMGLTVAAPSESHLRGMYGLCENLRTSAPAAGGPCDNGLSYSGVR